MQSPSIGTTIPASIARRLCAWCAAAAMTASQVLPATALGGDFSLLLNGKAVHLDPKAGTHYNEENWGLGLQYDFTAPGRKWIPFLNASEFLDSNSNVSWYAGGGVARRFDLPGGFGGHVDLGLVGFAMHREGFHDGDLFPGILPVVSIGGDRVALNVTYIPKVDPKMVALVFFQLKVGLQ
jgi:hypothetical protein